MLLHILKFTDEPSKRQTFPYFRPSQSSSRHLTVPRHFFWVKSQSGTTGTHSTCLRHLLGQFAFASLSAPKLVTQDEVGHTPVIVQHWKKSGQLSVSGVVSVGIRIRAAPVICMLRMARDRTEQNTPEFIAPSSFNVHLRGIDMSSHGEALRLYYGAFNLCKHYRRYPCYY
jgi:hypothetical protein